MRCISCQYDLSKLTEHRCPECGRAFDPNDLSTVDLSRANNQFWLWPPLLLLMVVSYGATLVFLCAGRSRFDFVLAVILSLLICPLPFLVLFIPFLWLSRLFSNR